MYINREKPHIIFVTETKLCPNDLTSDCFRLSNYTSYRKDREVINGGGGVIILVHNSLHSENSQITHHDTETITCKIKFGSRSLLAACVYRPPNSPEEYNNRINKVFKDASDSVDQILICGDFNYPRIDWINHLIHSDETSAEQKFYDECQNSFFHQHVTDFTRQRGVNEPSVLDLIFSKNELEIEEIKYDPPICKSDHAVLVFDFTLERVTEVEECVFPKKSFFKGNYIEMNLALQPICWSSLVPMNVQDKWDYILLNYTANSNKFIPEGFSSGGGIPNQKWMTRDAGLARRNKFEKWMAHRKKRTPGSYATYVRARNDSVRALRLAKQSYELKIAEDIKRGDSRVFYSYMRGRTSIKEEVSKVTKTDGTLSVSIKQTADIINRTFQSVFVREGNEPLPQITYHFDGLPLEDVVFTVHVVHKILSTIKESSAPGPDGIHPKVLKECADNLSLPFYLLFRDSLDTGIVPDAWKTAYVTPIYKKGKKK